MPDPTVTSVAKHLISKAEEFDAGWPGFLRDLGVNLGNLDPDSLQWMLTVPAALVASARLLEALMDQEATS